MSLARIKCPKCGKQMQKKLLKITRGKCSNCGFSLASSLAKFSSARSRVQSKYR
ncbi:MAG: hypothetical protein J4452_04140 [Candidatus Aenigmarchaeota archaeon]|nr:hypothetical protein [Candidatus Aenigmarchaeota archaeon]